MRRQQFELIISLSNLYQQMRKTKNDKHQQENSVYISGKYHFLLKEKQIQSSILQTTLFLKYLRGRKKIHSTPEKVSFSFPGGKTINTNSFFLLQNNSCIKTAYCLGVFSRSKIFFWMRKKFSSTNLFAYFYSNVQALRLLANIMVQGAQLLFFFK